MWKCDKYAPLVDKRAARCDSIIILQATSFGHVGVIITNKRAERLAAFTGFHRQCKLRFTLCASLRYGSDFFLNRNCCASAALAVWAEREKKIGAHAEEEAQCCIKCRKRRQRRVKNDETGKKKKVAVKEVAVEESNTCSLLVGIWQSTSWNTDVIELHRVSFMHC